MTRVRRGFKARRRRKKVLARAKGFRGTRHSLFRTAIHVVRRALKYAYRDRRVKKRNFRQLWVTRINAAARSHGLKYSQLIFGLKKQGVLLDRSVLSDLAIHDSQAFGQLVQLAKTSI